MLSVTAFVRGMTDALGFLKPRNGVVESTVAACASDIL